LSNYRHVVLKVGTPLDLAEYLADEEPASDEVHVRRVVYAMLRRLERERRVVTGPAEKPPDRVRDEILRSPKLRAAMKQLALSDEESERQLNHRADAILKKLQATPDGSTISALEVLLDRVFHRIYAGIDVDREGLARVREASKEGTLILLPSHKSHIDYLILSYVFNDENLQLPLIAAGDNLSFFPLGAIFRRAGAFFIRRSFKGDRLYPAVVDAYIRRLIRDGFPLELFIEGGRSRTGKLLAPKFGLLGMMVDATLALPQKKVFFVPISIGYERIVETNAYQRELAGADKVREDAAGLLKTTDVLRHRYGRINLQFATILTLDELRQELKLPMEGELRPAQRRSVLTRLANRVMDEINRVTAVSPGALTALALLSHTRRGLPHEELVERSARLLMVLREMGARIAPATATPSGSMRPEAIREAAQMFTNAELIVPHAPTVVDGGPSRADAATAGPGVIYTIDDEKRVELDTTKNIVIHFFVERALVATEVLAGAGPPVTLAEVRERVRRLSRLFKFEFRFRADAPFDEIFAGTIRTMTAAEELVVTADGGVDAGAGRLGWSGREWLLTYAAFVQNFIEGYRVAARGLGALLKGPLAEKELVKKALSTGERMFFTGELERREAVNQAIVQNAYAAFADHGWIRAQDGKLELIDTSVEGVRVIEARVVEHLSREVPE
jgi:glycerol-3-phosphate O-acyltransferase